MREYISEGRAMYEDENHGLFSKRLAEWAISNMETMDSATKMLRKMKPVALDDVKSALKKYDVELPDAFLYTAWYLYNMAMADYPKSITTEEHRALFVEETLCDPDGAPENVLACFEAKMREADIPIYWEKYL